MKGYKGNIEELVAKNMNFREVIYTAKHTQLVIMSLNPREEIGAEVHKDSDQFFRFESGEGKVIIDDNEYDINGGDIVIVPAGATHNVINVSSNTQLKFYTLYSPPHHRDKVIHKTKQEAENDSEYFEAFFFPFAYTPLLALWF